MRPHTIAVSISQSRRLITILDHQQVTILDRANRPVERASAGTVSRDERISIDGDSGVWIVSSIRTRLDAASQLT